MKIKDILNRYPNHKRIRSIYEYRGTPAIYLQVFNSKVGYVGQTGNLCKRLKNALDQTPILRFYNIDPKKFPFYLLEAVEDDKKRKAAEKKLVREFGPILLNIEHSRYWEEGKINRHTKAIA